MQKFYTQTNVCDYNISSATTSIYNTEDNELYDDKKYIFDYDNIYNKISCANDNASSTTTNYAPDSSYSHVPISSINIATTISNIHETIQENLIKIEDDIHIKEESDIGYNQIESTNVETMDLKIQENLIKLENDIDIKEEPN